MPPPELVVFSQPAGTARQEAPPGGGGGKLAYKAFMSHKIAKINAKPPAPRTEAERREEEDDRRRDRELRELLEGRVMIEKLHEAQLSGRERHKHNAEKLARLGMKVKTKLKMPANAYFASVRNRAEKVRREVQDAKDRGVLSPAMKRSIEVAHLGKPSDDPRRRHRRADRGPDAGPGRFKDGVLHISKSHIDRVSRAASSGASSRIGKKQQQPKSGKKPKAKPKPKPKPKPKGSRR
ncbi:hypothetical protein H4R18_003798 [Coemansia javaensis]|uniref:Uncharacterized protein n=1 Tax=Coemansia javaensis TaxID=2761396 RepID=A0A9W8HAW5_9FUNG|nr:hypothetical protein H4R18_003798 [Coemansia javaensis]